MASTKSSLPEVVLSRMHWPITVLGHGRRVGIWFQGCSIGCPGCCATDTWDAAPARGVGLERILAWIDGLPTEEIDGFTISGGEPFDQPEALQALVREIRLRFDSARVDVLLYSGYSWRRLRARHPEVLLLVDVVISGPYRRDRKQAWLRGSANQELHRLSALARERYVQEADAEPDSRRIQFQFDGDEVWFAGIPRPGELDRLAAMLQERGIVLRQNSWD